MIDFVPLAFDVLHLPSVSGLGSVVLVIDSVVLVTGTVALVTGTVALVTGLVQGELGRVILTLLP